MILGNSYEAKAQKKALKTKEQIYKIIPRKIFAWVPHRLENDGRKVWLQLVWKSTDINFNSYYYLDEFEAYKDCSGRCGYYGYDNNLRQFYSEVFNIIVQRMRVLKNSS